MARLLVVCRILGILLVAHGLMLLGADEISTIENGGLRTIRSFETILTLYRVDPKPLLMALPVWLGQGLGALLSLPGWAVLFAVGGLIAFAARDRS